MDRLPTAQTAQTGLARTAFGFGAVKVASVLPRLVKPAAVLFGMHCVQKGAAEIVNGCIHDAHRQQVGDAGRRRFIEKLVRGDREPDAGGVEESIGGSYRIAGRFETCTGVSAGHWADLCLLAGTISAKLGNIPAAFCACSASLTCRAVAVHREIVDNEFAADQARRNAPVIQAQPMAQVGQILQRG
ncbi:MAG: hypothetical protein O3A01_07980 [bacterium]|nr:hypothetical protein [bacterium]